MSSIHAGAVMDPPAYVPADLQKLSERLKPLYTIWAALSPTPPPSIGTSSYADVRDVIVAHLWAAEHPKIVNGERDFTSSGYGAGRKRSLIYCGGTTRTKSGSQPGRPRK